MITDATLYRLMAWLSPTFPVGGYTFSHGMEYAVEEGLIKDGETLRRWVEAIVSHGTGKVEADLFRIAWRAVKDDDGDMLAWAAERANAMRATSEMALESIAQGQAFLGTLRSAWPRQGFERWAEVLSAMDFPPSYAVAVGLAAALEGIALKTALTAFLHAFAANLVSAGLRLVPLGQTDGQKVLAALEETVIAAAGAALERGPEDLGGAAPMVDWTSMKHETQYTRLFRS